MRVVNSEAQNASLRRLFIDSGRLNVTEGGVNVAKHSGCTQGAHTYVNSTNRLLKQSAGFGGVKKKKTNPYHTPDSPLLMLCSFTRVYDLSPAAEICMSIFTLRVH